MFYPDETQKAPGMGGNVDSSKIDSPDWENIARSSFESSTSYVESNLRADWVDGERAFNNQHPIGSKYLHSSFAKKSRLYRPKTRTIIRKNEAAAAAAFFSQMDVISVEATDQSDKNAVISANIVKNLLNFRLSKTIPWFQVVMGAIQEAQTLGSVCAHVHWVYEEAHNQQIGMDGELPKRKVLVDKPVIELVPLENLRISPSADWTDPINSSPFIVHIMPLTLNDVKARIASGEWASYSDDTLLGNDSDRYSSLKTARQGGKADPQKVSGGGYRGYDTCWIQRHIHRKDGEDWEFYTTSNFMLLTQPSLLRHNLLHIGRPYVLGKTILEVHKVYPASLAKLGKDLQEESNEISNSRRDNVRLVLNKKYILRRDAQADAMGLVRNTPGGVILADDPEKDIRELSWSDVTASSYEEQNNLDGDMNELLGNFSAAQVMADHGIEGPARNMAMLGQSAGTLVEYLLRTFVETFIQPVLRLLVKLEQAYETDQTVLAIAAKDAQLFQRFGVSDVLDEMLESDVTLTVNVGMGATDPNMKLRKFVAAMQEYTMMLKNAPPGINMDEVGKEIFGYMGYRDGARFLSQDNPQVLMLQQQMQQMQQQLAETQAKLQDNMLKHQVELQKAQLNNETKLHISKMQQDAANLRSATTHIKQLVDADNSRTHELNMTNLDRAHTHAMTNLDRTHAVNLSNLAQAHERSLNGLGTPNE